MAASQGYDGYRSQPDPFQAHYPTSSFDSAYDPRAYPSSSYQQESHHAEIPRPRSRASSNAQSESLPPPSQQPLKNVLSNAFDKSDAARTVDPDLIAQITAEVKKSVMDEIKLNGVHGVTSQPPLHPAPQPYIPHSPTSTSASFPSRNAYTPPSPKHLDSASHSSASPDFLTQDSAIDGSGDTPTPRHDQTAPINIQHEGVPRPRPPPVPRMSTDVDFTPIEKMWQRLFDPDDQPTPRLGQFLRGLAIHLIDDYEPKKSLVIPPAKMLKFYEDVRLSEETYPWRTIFGKLSYPTLSKIYREMRCEHHFIQEHLADPPQIPALTPVGFQEWMTAMIQAYPDAEYERLSKAVMDMPISNADDCRERFPKELPRRLFPRHENLQAQQRCAAALSAEGVGPLRKAPSFPPPPPMGHNNGPSPNLGRERSPYATQTSQKKDSRAIESDDEGALPPSIPLERERKPYSAAPGGGKVYEDDLSRSMHADISNPDHRKRTQSTASQSQRAPPLYHHHPRTNSTATGRRPRSPSFSNYGTRSDPNVRDIPDAYYSSKIYDDEEEKRRFAKDAEMKRNDWARRQAEEGVASGRSRRNTISMSDSSHDSQPRSVYNDDYYRSKSGTNGYDNRGHESRRY